MPVVVSMVVAGVAALLVLVSVGALVQGSTDRALLAGDPAPVERWFVDHVAQHPRLRHVVALLDRHVWGGAMVALGLGAVCIAAGVVGWILSTIDRGSGFARFDQSVAEWGADHATASSTTVLRATTLLGGSIVVLLVLIAVGALALLRSPSHNWALPGFLLTVGVGIVLVNNTLKWIVERDRPTVSHLVGSAGSSFPSGHSASAAACWAAVSLVVARRWPATSRRLTAAVAVAIAVLVASSRVLLGVHWLTDVVAGLVVGWTWFFVVALIFGGRIQRFGEPAERVTARDPAIRSAVSVVEGVRPRGPGSREELER
jgi:undecaprenyl-diphosphatase